MRSLGLILILILILILTACGGSPKPPEPAKPIGNQVKPAAELDPQHAREQHLEHAPSMGVLGSLSDCGGSGYGGATYGCDAFASETDTIDLSSAVDDARAAPRHMGTAGTGARGGTGSGPNLGTGTGYGVGGGRGGMRGRQNSPAHVRIGQPTADAGLDKAVIRRYIKRNIQKIQYCYEKELLQDAQLAGKVTTKFTIGTDGKVTTATATGLHAGVAACVANVIQAIEFPKPKASGVVNVIYPFVFRSQGD